MSEDKTTYQIMQDLKQWAKDCAEDYYENGEGEEESDYAHQCADGARSVFINWEAWQTVSACRLENSDLYGQANDQLRDTEGNRLQDGETLDDAICRLSYWIHHTALLDAIDEHNA